MYGGGGIILIICRIGCVVKPRHASEENYVVEEETFLRLQLKFRLSTAQKNGAYEMYFQMQSFDFGKRLSWE